MKLINGREGAIPAHDNQKLFYDNSGCVEKCLYENYYFIEIKTKRV